MAKVAPGWAEREPGCRYEVVPRAGHNANQDNPAFFNRALLEFLGGCRHPKPGRKVRGSRRDQDRR